VFFTIAEGATNPVEGLEKSNPDLINPEDDAMFRDEYTVRQGRQVAFTVNSTNINEAAVSSASRSATFYLVVLTPLALLFYYALDQNDGRWFFPPLDATRNFARLVRNRIQRRLNPNAARSLSEMGWLEKVPELIETAYKLYSSSFVLVYTRLSS